MPRDRWQSTIMEWLVTVNKLKIALVTAVAARTLDEDLAPLESALRAAGADVTIAEWDLPHDWSGFDAARPLSRVRMDL